MAAATYLMVNRSEAVLSSGAQPVAWIKLVKSLMNRRSHIVTVQIAGLHVLIPPKSSDGTKQVFPLTTSVSGKDLSIGEIATDNAVLEFIPRQRGADRFVLKIDHLVLDHVGESDPLTFHARFSCDQPPARCITI